PVVLADEGRSDYRIYLGGYAPGSVWQAARELQHYIRLATGAELAIVHGADQPKSHFISLGDNELSRRAGIDASQIPMEGYRLLTRDGNVYIVGVDTPHGHYTPQGGVSAGTRHGAYTFLEDYLGVR